MSFKTALRKLLPMRWQRTTGEKPLTVVLLLVRPHLFSVDELRQAAERAFRTPFSGQDGSPNCVSQSGQVTFLKAGPHVVNLFYYPKPYIDNPKDNVTWLPQAIQREAWIKHSACVGVDYLNGGVAVSLAYSVLLKLIAEVIDGNCTAVYIPRENRLIPNHESIYMELQRFASSRDLGIPKHPNPD